jgi:rhodanese-related sulfurtransferase
MKKKVTLLALVLTLTMVFSSISVFAGYYEEAGIETYPGKVTEFDAETIAVNLANETKSGGYKLMDTATLKKYADKKDPNVIIVDTMPAPWFAKRHVPGAINAFAPLSGEPYSNADKANLVKQLRAKKAFKNVKQYWNSKTKKWQDKKPKAKYYKKCSKKKDPNYGKKTRTVERADNSKTIIVYCGFVKCTRSHVAAQYLVSQGFTNVYRQPGGISAYVDKFGTVAVDGTNPDEVLPDFSTVDKDSADWARCGINFEDVALTDYILDVRPVANYDAGHIAGSVNVPVPGDYSAVDKEALLNEYGKAAADGRRVVIVCVKGRTLAGNAMQALKEMDVDMSKVTYLIGGASAIPETYLVPTETPVLE